MKHASLLRPRLLGQIKLKIVALYNRQDSETLDNTGLYFTTMYRLMAQNRLHRIRIVNMALTQRTHCTKNHIMYNIKNNK